jgi:O-antigen/teichoic acid export membrane protein
MEYILIGLVSAFNLIIILHKFKCKRIEDGIFDVLLFILLVGLFKGSYSGMVVGMVASLCVSTYLWFYPPTFFKKLNKLRKFMR